MRRTNLFFYLAFLALFCGASPVLAQVAPNLGTAAPFAVLGPTAVTCTTSTINGDVGTQAASITNTGCTLNGATNLNLGAQIVTDLNAAKGEVDGQTCTTIQAGTLAGITLGPGVHCFAAGAALTGLLTLSGNASDVWIFRIGTGGPADLAATDFTVQFSGSGLACNVFWRSSQDVAVTRGGFLGTILSGRDIAVTGVGTYGGRLLATRSLTMTNETMSFAGCSAPASITVRKDFLPNSTATVPVALSCTSGTITTAPATMSEAAPAVFRVGGASLSGATCTATETVPANYTANQAACASVALNGSCTITNTLATVEPPPGTLPTTPPAGCPVIGFTPTTLPNGNAGVAYSQQFTGNSGTAPYFFTTTLATLPAGIALSTSGLLSGTPTTALAQTFTIRATDSLGCFVQQPYTMRFGVEVPTLPQVFTVTLGFGLLVLGYLRLQRRRSGV